MVSPSLTQKVLILVPPDFVTCYHFLNFQEKEMQRKMDMEMGGWVTSSQNETVGSQPQMEQARY